MPPPDERAAASATCPACRGVGATHVAANDIVNMVRCGACGLVYLHPQPVAQVRTKYIEAYDLAEHFGPLAARKRVLYERRFAKIPPPVAGKSRVCDVGCGDGQFLGLAKERGWVPYGIEMNPPAAARARERGASVSVGVIEELDDLEWGTFDLVTSWDVLEHTPTPREFAERLVRLLAPHGTLVVTTLNLPSLAWRTFGVDWSMVGEDHFTYWDKRSMTTLFESLGLEVLDCDIFGLGRDFVRALDGWRGRAASVDARSRSNAPQAANASAVTAPRSPDASAPSTAHATPGADRHSSSHPAGVAVSPGAGGASNAAAASDAPAPSGASVPSSASGPSLPPPAEGGGWDVSAGTLALESVLNRFLRTFGGGVGIGLTMRRAGSAAAR